MTCSEHPSRAPRSERSAGPIFFAVHTSSVLALILANLVPVYGALYADWTVFELLLLFWLENVAIGVFFLARILVAEPDERSAWAKKVVMVPFFILHYGFFAALHVVFLLTVFGGGEAGSALSMEPWVSFATVFHVVGAAGLGWAVLPLVASHGVSFVTNYLGKGEYRRVTVTQMVAQPYARVGVLTVVIVLGGGAVLLLGSPLPALLLLVALKIGLDLRAHVREHRKLAG